MNNLDNSMDVYKKFEYGFDNNIIFKFSWTSLISA